MSSKSSFSMPDELAARLAKYKSAKQPWEQFNISQVCAEAIDKKLKDGGY